MEIFEIGDQLVDGRLRQLDAGLRDVPPHFGARIECASWHHAGLDAGDLRQRRDEAGPVFALRRQHRAAAVGDAVIAAAALARLLHPSALDQRALFEAIERGVERRHREVHRAAGSQLDLPPDLVAVVIRFVDQREDEEIGAAFLGGVDGGPVRLTRLAGQVISSLVIYRKAVYQTGARSRKGWWREAVRLRTLGLRGGTCSSPPRGIQA